MRANHLAVVFPVRGLPQNTEQARTAIWAETSRLLVQNMGKLYASFYPAARPWGVNIRTPFCVVLGRDDPSGFLHLFMEARKRRGDAMEYHVASALVEAGPDKVQVLGDSLICPVVLDGTNKRLEAHIFWQTALVNGAVLPDCGIYYAERKRSTVELGLEKMIESNPADYALCMVTLMHMMEETV